MVMLAVEIKELYLSITGGAMVSGHTESIADSVPIGSLAIKAGFKADIAPIVA
jgi:hypothetical protein